MAKFEQHWDDRIAGEICMNETLQRSVEFWYQLWDLFLDFE
jgi:hypothetical protein